MELLLLGDTSFEAICAMFNFIIARARLSLDRAVSDL